MYPYDIILGFDLYELCFTLAFMSAFVCFRLVGDKLKMNVKVYNMCIISGLFTIGSGIGGAVLFQAFYDYLETGVFSLADAGMTFYGGFICGVAAFLIVYFAVFAIWDKENKRFRSFFFISDVAAPCIALAHSIGRLGCVFAGCCHGRVTDAWYGIYTARLDAKTVPTALFESAVLLAIFGVLLWRVLRGKSYGLSIYLAGYGVWRFFIEYFRADERGESPIPFLSPSQLTAVVLILVAAALAAVMKHWFKSHPLRADLDADASDESVTSGAEE